MELPPCRQTPPYLSDWGEGVKREGGWVKETQKDENLTYFYMQSVLQVAKFLVGAKSAQAVK